MSPVIVVENLSKKYIIGHQKRERYTALRDVLADGAKRFTNKLIHSFAAPLFVGSPSISTQVLSETANVASKRFALPVVEVRKLINDPINLN